MVVGGWRYATAVSMAMICGSMGGYDMMVPATDSRGLSTMVCMYSNGYTLGLSGNKYVPLVYTFPLMKRQF